MKFELRVYEKRGRSRRYVKKITISSEKNIYYIAEAFKFAMESYMKRFGEESKYSEQKEESLSQDK